MHFSRILTNSPEKSIFSKINFKQLNIYYKSFWIFSKNNLKFSLFIEPTYKSREISGKFYYQLSKFIKNLNKIGLDPEGTIGMRMKIIENLGENRL